jgi:hypothetical protein
MSTTNEAIGAKLITQYEYTHIFTQFHIEYTYIFTYIYMYPFLYEKNIKIYIIRKVSTKTTYRISSEWSYRSETHHSIWIYTHIQCNMYRTLTSLTYIHIHLHTCILINMCMFIYIYIRVRTMSTANESIGAKVITQYNHKNSTYIYIMNRYTYTFIHEFMYINIYT